ncbi:MAG TPA: phytanoyl-CoA dioxygenase family protein [Lacunisphaera sp.]|nr:phytanoyl-CoA dioxygenase family protein [Lacunisphaera sp.]
MNRRAGSAGSPGRGAIGWDHRETARAYEAFCRDHARYQQANRHLVRHAALKAGLRCLDLAAGTGLTTAAARAKLGPAGRVVCVEPAAAMRHAGRGRLGSDPRISWRGDWPEEEGTFDLVLCGAAIWQMPSLAGTIARVWRLLAPGGLFAFNVPSAYLGEPDDAGGGADPLLQALPAGLAARANANLPPVAVGWRADRDAVERALQEAGFRLKRWQFRVRLTQSALRDWLKIPVLTDYRLAGLTAKQRSALVDEVFAEVDACSWKWERWTGWTATKPARPLPSRAAAKVTSMVIEDPSVTFDVRPLVGSDPSAESTATLRRRASRDGYLFVRGLVDAGDVMRLGARAVQTSADLVREHVPQKGTDGQWHVRWLEWQREMATAAELPPVIRNEAVIRLLECLTGHGAEPIPAQVFRALEPRRPEFVTQPHQDGFYLGPGTGDFWVAWLPLQSCPLELGPLALLRGSHKGGLLPHDRAPGGGNGAQLPASAAAAPWDAGALEPGDVLLFHRLTLHRSCPNLTASEYRFSVDYRLRPGSR